VGPNQIRMPAAQTSEHDASQIRGFIKEKNPGLFLISFLSLYTGSPIYYFLCSIYTMHSAHVPFRFTFLYCLIHIPVFPHVFSCSSFFPFLPLFFHSCFCPLFSCRLHLLFRHFIPFPSPLFFRFISLLHLLILSLCRLPLPLSLTSLPSTFFLSQLSLFLCFC
jgi:hypothetical protein